MAKKLFLLSTVLYVLLFFGLPGKVLADASAQFKQAKKSVSALIKSGKDAEARAAIDNLIAEFSGDPNLPATIRRFAIRYKEAKKYEQAKSIFKKVATVFPDTDDALKSQIAVARMDVFGLIDSGNDAAAQAAIDKIIADFSGNPYLPANLYYIARKYEKLEKYEQAESLYGRVMSDFPGSDGTFMVQRDLVSQHISAKRDDDARRAMDKLIAEFNDHSNLPETLRRFAARYKEAKKYEQAKSIRREIATLFPDTDAALKSQIAVARMDVFGLMDSGNDAAAQAAIDKLIADFSGNPYSPANLGYIAGRYKQAKQYERAGDVYQQVAQHHPDSNGVAKAQLDASRMDVLSLIKSDDDPNAQAAIESLIADFNDYQRLPRVLRNFAEKYRKAKKYEQAGDIYQQVAQHHPHPDSNGVTRAQLDASRMDILSFMEWGDDPNAQAAIEGLIADFNDYQRLPAVLRNFARKYRVAGKYEEAESIYETIAADFPDTNDALRAQMAASMMNILTFIEGGYDAAATAAIDKLIAGFNDHPGLPGAVFVLGEEYYNKAFQMENEGLGAQARDCFAKAITIWGRIITELPISTPHTTYAYHFSAACYRRLGNYGMAIEYYQKVVDNWPDYKYAWNAQFLIGRSYEDLEKSGLILESEADPMIKAAYEQLLEKYPDCAAAKIARRWLSRLK